MGDGGGEHWLVRM